MSCDDDDRHLDRSLIANSTQKELEDSETAGFAGELSVQLNHSQCWSEWVVLVEDDVGRRTCELAREGRLAS